MTNKAIIIATGPSLTHADAAKAWSLWLRDGWNLYAVNDAHSYIPLTDEFTLYACDEEWWNEYHNQTRRVMRRVTTNDAAAAKYGLEYIPGQHAEQAGRAFDASGKGIVYGGNGGFQALNLAYADGMRDVVLLGFDMGHDPGEPSHCHGEHPHHLRRASPYKSWLEHWRKAAPEIERAGMRVRNATRRTFLDVFPRVNLEDLE